ncbi:MAG TPA: PadR family transcriptional regulator [Acidobacteriaceae bacterium]|jgi:transcriptional regulator|nr:PadR family transcriptional regulator [Acidobacteriaceae bacterium]
MAALIRRKTSSEKTSPDKGRDEIPPGTLYLLILKTLAGRGRLHGYEIAEAILSCSDEVLQVEEGSLYPALQRMLIQGWVTAEWGVTTGNRRARYYTLTVAGRKQLGIEMSQFERVMGAIVRVLETA